MKTLYEHKPSEHAVCGFYLAKNQVLFTYEGPFDTDTNESIYLKGSFPQSEFALFILIVDQNGHAEITGFSGETLQLRRLDSGLMSLEFNRSDDGIVISDLDIPLSDISLANVAQ